MSALKEKEKEKSDEGNPSLSPPLFFCSYIAIDKKAKSFSERLVTKILDNLQILINKIHIRFEDEHEGKV